MPNKTVVCRDSSCSYTARAPLQRLAGCRGHHETPAEPRRCPHGHGELVDPPGANIRYPRGWTLDNPRGLDGGELLSD